jgi:signal transduction histidine kinase
MASAPLIRLRTASPFALALAALALLFYAAAFQTRLPYDGLDWTPITGEVLLVDPEGPAAGSIFVGDEILSVQGVPGAQATHLYARFQTGEHVRLLVRRSDNVREVTLVMASASPQRLLLRLGPLLVALAFLVIGSVVLGFGGTRPQARLFFLYALVGASVLASGSLSTKGPLWTSALFNILLAVAGPVSVHLHLHFPEDRGATRWRLPLALLYGVAVLLSLPFVLAGPTAIQASALNATFFAAGRLYLGLNLLLVVLLLVRSYRQAGTVQARQKIRLVALGGSLAFLLVLALIVGPDVLILRAFVPYELGLFFLIILPLAYGYAILRHRLIQLEGFVSRGAAYTLVFVALLGIYLVLTSLVSRWLPSRWLQQPVVNMLQVLILAGSAVPIYRRIQSLVDWVFYGGWYDYRSAVERITAGLAGLKDAEALAERITERLRSVLRLDGAHLFVLFQGDALALQPAKDGRARPLPDPLPSFPAQGFLAEYLRQRPDPVSTEEARTNLAEAPLTKAERVTLEFLHQSLLVPVTDSKQLLGLLALGQRQGGERFSAEDHGILRIVARHAAAAIENIQLLRELRMHAAEVEKLHRQLLHAREDERKLLARELHDEAIQALVGLNYRLAQMDNGAAGEMQAEVRQIVEDLRGMIRTLRPPALDNFGLVTAIRSHVRELGEAGGETLRIDLRVEGDTERWLPEDIQLCLYRVMQEALINVEKHASARRVQVTLDIQPTEVRLEIRDDGRGFHLPQHLGSLLEQDHFGLVGLRERLELVRGSLQILSSPGEGTRLTASVPLPGEGQDA